MPSILALLLFVPSPLANLRVESAKDAYRECLAMEAIRLLNDADIGPSGVADFARQRCYVLERDIRHVLPAMVENMFREKGIKTISQSMVDLLADETLKAIIAEQEKQLIEILTKNRDE